jgi:hypothetical protein
MLLKFAQISASQYFSFSYCFRSCFSCSLCLLPVLALRLLLLMLVQLPLLAFSALITGLDGKAAGHVWEFRRAGELAHCLRGECLAVDAVAFLEAGGS